MHQGQLGAGQESKMVGDALAALAKATGTRPRGWLSTATSQSWSTPDLLQRHSIEYCCDWDNDDLPYFAKPGDVRLVHMATSPDIDDFAILIKNHHFEDDFTQQ